MQYGDNAQCWNITKTLKFRFELKQGESLNIFMYLQSGRKSEPFSSRNALKFQFQFSLTYFPFLQSVMHLSAVLVESSQGREELRRRGGVILEQGKVLPHHLSLGTIIYQTEIDLTSSSTIWVYHIPLYIQLAQGSSHDNAK